MGDCSLLSNSRRIKLDQYTVYLGKNAINETNPSKEQKFKVAKLQIHEEYDHVAENFNHDIGTTFNHFVRLYMTHTFSLLLLLLC